jgi:alpha-ketoglutarate-dependent taurine dioxygenase
MNISTADTESLTLLSAKGYIIRSDESYKKNHKENTALISKSESDLYHLRYDPSFTEFIAKEYDDSSRQLKLALDQNHKEFQLETGDLLIFNNKISSHKRSNFNPSYSGTDRWVQRIMLS